jgi:hypothetical protein
MDDYGKDIPAKDGGQPANHGLYMSFDLFDV